MFLFDNNAGIGLKGYKSFYDFFILFWPPQNNTLKLSYAILTGS